MQMPRVLMVPSDQRASVMSGGKSRLTTVGRKPQVAEVILLCRLMEKKSPMEMILNINPTLRLQLYRKQIPTTKIEDTSIISHSPEGTQGSTEEPHKTGLEPATMVVVAPG